MKLMQPASSCMIAQIDIEQYLIFNNSYNNKMRFIKMTIYNNFK